MQTLNIDDEIYVKKSDTPAQAPNRNRCVVVVDRGWIFAGDVADDNGRIKITRAVHVRRWSGVWFDGMLENPESDDVDIAKLQHDIDLPSDAELFRVSVTDDWGL